MSAASGDKTVNKVALCSAIFAGFAYVGYSVVRTAFCRKLGRRDGDGYENEHRLYFRRLSQTTQTDVLLGNLDTSGSGRIVLRPMTVQERIRDLNLRARLFTDTMLAVQSSGYVPHRSGKPGPRSLQCSPWSSPRILSPVDVRTFLASRSTENLNGLGAAGAAEAGTLRIAGGEAILVAGSPMHRRWVRRTQRQIRGPEFHREEECREAESMLHNGEEELRKRLDNVGGQGRPLTVHEAKSLVALLHSSDEALLERTMITIANCSTYSANQNMIREAGGLVRLQNLLQHPRHNIQLAAMKALSNLALNEDNQKEMKDCIPVLLSYVNRSDLVTGVMGELTGTRRHVSEATLLAALVALTNVAVLSAWHDEFVIGLHGLYRLVDVGSSPVRLQALRLLVNLSCNDDMAPSLLAAQAPKRILHQLDPSGPQDILLRLVTLLANLVSVARRQEIEAIDLPAEEKAASPDTMYSAIFGVHVRDKLACKASVLSSQHPDEDVRIQAGRLYEVLKS